jgi:retron-type reverse transcriptase
MSQLIFLKAAKTLADAARLIGFQPAALSYLLYKRPPESNYQKFDIPKRSGGVRHISAPNPELKLVQRRLADLLQNSVIEINRTNRYHDTISHGFKRKRSIITNARKHRRRRYVFNVDLRNFFESINFGRVRGYFIKDRNFSLDPAVATVIAQISCYENSLPQGSPSSPVISNLIGHVLDIHLSKLAADCGCTYSRYADDLTFSTNKRQFPGRIAYAIGTNPHAWLPGIDLLALVHKSGFELNATKTRMQYRDSRQEVTGLIVNSKVNVRCEYRHAIRAMVHSLVTTGKFELFKSAKNSQGQRQNESVAGTNEQLHGMLGFIDQVDRYNKELKRRQGHQAKEDSSLSSKELMYRRFLLFTYFYSATRPTIVCEGPTDNVYLVHAIRALAANYPKLASVAQDGKISLAIRLLKYAESGTGRILGIQSGGSANLSNLIRTYHKEKAKFTAPGLTQPVVILVDNDEGGKCVFEAVAQITKSKATRKEDFLHVTGNLYVIATPFGDNGTSRIEDCFDAKAISIPVDGKTFDPGKNFDLEKHFGKKVFAHKVVAQQANNIDFSGFAPILDRIVSVIDAHAEKNVTAEAVGGLLGPQKSHASAGLDI